MNSHEEIEKSASTHIESSFTVDEETYPDGGTKAWSTVLGGFLSFAGNLGYLYGFAVFQSYYQTVVLPDHSASDISWIGSLQLWGCFFFGLPAGHMLDRYGPRLPIAIGTFFLVLGNMMASLSTKYWQFVLSQGVCIAIGSGFAFTPALAVQSQWFLRRRGLAVGIVMSGQNVGGVIWPVIVNQLINYHGISLAWTLRIAGFIQLGMMGASTVLIFPRFTTSTPVAPIPKTTFLTDKRTVVFSFASFIFFLGIYIPNFYSAYYGTLLGASARLAFYFPAILNATSVSGCFIIGLISDLGLDFFNSITGVAFAAAIVAFGWIGVNNIGGLIAWFVFYGFASGAVQALFSPCISMLAPSPTLIGNWNGMLMVVISFAVLGTGPIAGQLLADSGYTSWLGMQLFTGFTLLVGAFLFLLTRIFVGNQGRFV